MFKKIFTFFKNYLFEELLLLVIFGFFFVQHPSIVFISIILFAYLFLVFLINNTFLSVGIKKAIHFLRQYTLEGFLLFITIVFMVVQKADWISILIIIFSYFFIVLLLNDTFLSKGIKKGIGDMKKEYLYTVLFFVFISLFFIWRFDIETIIFLALFIAFVFYGWDSRILATGALVSLASCPFLLSFKQDAYAELMAVYAYYFLVMTVILQIIEYKRHPELFAEDEEDKINN